MEYPEVFWKGITQLKGDTYEGCWFHQVSFDPVCPDFEFEVRLEDPKNGKLINRVSIVIHADHQVRQFVQTHPLWRNDPRPFLLMNIQELMWSLKLLRTEYKNPHKQQIGVAFKQGGTLHFDIKAEVFVDFGGTHIIQLVNYANTHVLDQLREVYKQNPEAEPSGEYIETFKQNFFQGLQKEENREEKGAKTSIEAPAKEICKR
jgi:hypothetical protein